MSTGAPYEIPVYDPSVRACGGGNANALVIDLRDWNGVTRDSDITTPLTEAIAQAGVYTATGHPNYRSATDGGAAIRLPEFRVGLTDTILYNSSIEIYGGGGTMGSQILFAPSSTKNAFEPSTNYGGLSGHHFPVFRGFSLFAQNNNAQDGIYITRTRGALLSGLFIYGFRRNGVYIGWVNNTYCFWNQLERVEFFDNACGLYLDSNANVGSAVACVFTTTAAGAAAAGHAVGDYLINVNAAGWSFNGCSFEGTPNLAIVRDAGSGNSYSGVYTETAALPEKPFIHVVMKANAASIWRGPNISGVAHQSTGLLVEFENYDIGAESSPYTPQDMVTVSTSKGRPIPLIQDGSFATGPSELSGLAVNVNHISGGLRIGTKRVFNSRASLRLRHDGSNVATQLSIPLSSRLAPYLGQLVFITACVYDPDNSITSLSITNPLRERWVAISYGNGWKLSVISFDVTSARLSSCVLQIFQNSAVAGTEAFITNIQAWVGGWPEIPAEHMNETWEYSAAPAAGTWTKGMEVRNNMASVTNVDRWRCTASGTFTSANETGDTVNGSPTIINMVDTTDFGIGDYVTVTAGFTGTRRIIDKTSSTLTLDANAASPNVGVTVDTPAATFVALALP